MKFAIDYTNESSFMKEWAKDPMIMNRDGEKNVSSGMLYRKSNVPGTIVNFAPKFKEGTGMLLKMSQEDLNKAVTELNFFDKNAKQVTIAPLGTQNHEFWKSEHAYLFIERGHADLDDTNPKDRIMLAAMRMDNSFYFKGETSKPPVKGIVKWTVTPIDGKHTAIVEDEGPSIKASKRLMSMDYATQLSISKIFGKEMADKTDPDIVQATLFKIITTERGLFYSDNVTYLQKFLQLTEGGNDDLNLEALANDCKPLLVKKSGMFYYGEIKMGTSMAAIVKKFKEDPDLLDEINKIVNRKK